MSGLKKKNVTGSHYFYRFHACREDKWSLFEGYVPNPDIVFYNYLQYIFWCRRKLLTRMNRFVLFLCGYVFIWMNGFKKKNVTGSRYFYRFHGCREDYYKWSLFEGYVPNPDILFYDTLHYFFLYGNKLWTGMNRFVLFLCEYVFIWMSGFKKKIVTGSSYFYRFHACREDYSNYY